MLARCNVSRLVFCSLAVLLLAAACVPITAPNSPLATAPAATPASAGPAPSVVPTGSGTVPLAAATSPASAAAATAAGPAPTQAAAAGERLVFASHQGGSSGGLYIMDAPQLGTAPTGAAAARQLTSDGGYWPVVSPDGNWIAYVVEHDPSNTPPQRDIWLVSVDGRQRFNMTQNSASNLTPAWSPDGLQIAFASTRGGDGYTISIWIQDVAPILAGQAPAPRQLVQVGSNPVWSPDGTQIAYLADKEGNNFTQLYTIKPDGTGERQLTAHRTDTNGSGVLVPAWSPDGRWLLVPMAFSGAKQQLVLLPVEGTTAPIPDQDLRIVTPDEAYADTPAWEADGRWVAFTACGGSEPCVAVMDMQSGEVRHIAPQLASMAPQWSTDGSRLAFTVQGSAPDYQTEIYVTDRDGSNPVNVTASPTQDINPAWVPPNRQPK